jgi:hypothetical protein
MKSMKRLRGRRPSPAMVVAMIALFAALGGTATALRGKNSVRSDDIRRNAVKASDIASGAVRTKDLASKAVKSAKLGVNAVNPFNTNLTRLGARTGDVTTTSQVPVDLGGPSVTVRVPKGGLVAILAEATMRVTGGGQNNEAQVRLYEPRVLPQAPTILATGSNAFENRFTSPGQGNQTGTGGDLRGGWLVFSAGAGPRTFTLRYAKQGGGTAIFQNPRLWISVIR